MKKINKPSGTSLAEIKCPVCGKTFIPAPLHGWKIKKYGQLKLVCTYTCQRTWEKKKYGR